MIDFLQMRDEFPITNQWIFLDNAGAVPLPRFVTETMRQFIDTYYCRGITDHWPLLEETVRACRELFARLVGAGPEEIALVSSTSEGLNIVANLLPFARGDNVVISDLEFPSNRFPWLNLERKGVKVVTAPLLGSASPIDSLAKCINRRTRLVAVSHVSFANGLKLDLREVSGLAHSHGAYLAVDAVQSAGVVPFDVHAAEVDFLACSGFKWLLSPSGTGAFYCRDELTARNTPAYLSWYSVENPFAFGLGGQVKMAADARRFMISGNINLIGYQGFRAGLTRILEMGVGNIEARIGCLKDLVLKRVGELDLGLISPPNRGAMGPIVNFRVPDPVGLLGKFRDAKVYAVERLGGIRLSPYIYNTEQEIATAMDVVEDHVRATRRGSRGREHA